jgi:hypothetical protein
MNTFISHSSAELAKARRVARALASSGVDSWLDDSDIQAGALLRDQLSTAIGNAGTFILLWSKSAAKSRWVAAELLTAFHLARPIIPCVCDDAPLPDFLSHVLQVDVSGQNRRCGPLLTRAVRDARFVKPLSMSSREPALAEAIRDLALKQQQVWAPLLQRDTASAERAQRIADAALADARRRWRYDAQLLNLAGYHYKNAYMLKYWQQIQAGLTPADKLLRDAEKLFFRALFRDPNDASALNGLASILLLEHELCAAEFFNARAIQLVAEEGGEYLEAIRDRAAIQYYLRRSGVSCGGSVRRLTGETG